MSVCRKLTDLDLWCYLDGEGDADERQRWAAHLAECPTCAQRLAVSRQVPLAVDGQEFAKPPPDLARQAVARVLVERERGDGRRAFLAAVEQGRRRWGALVPAAQLLVAANLVLVGAVLAEPALAGVGGDGGVLSNSMAQAASKVLLPLATFFHDWGWFAILLGMVGVLIGTIGRLAFVGNVARQ